MGEGINERAERLQTKMRKVLAACGFLIRPLAFLVRRSRKRQKISSQIVIYICSNPRPLGSATAIDIADMLAG